MSEFKRPWYFNMNKDGDEAVIRILHSKPETIEKVLTHTIEVEGKKKRIKSLGEDCPITKSGKTPYERIFIHVFDYTDNKNKVWDRTPTILPQLDELYKDWQPLSDAVIRIKRVGDDFPKYELHVLNPTSKPEVDKELIDKPLSRMYHLTRKVEDIETFLKTGKFPEKEPFLSKEEYAAKKKAEEAAKSATSTQTTTTVAEEIEDDGLPF